MNEYELDCPKCGEACWREEVDVGVGIIYGPWGCECCGWSSDRRYDRGDAEARAAADAEHPDHIVDQFGGLTPKAGVVEKLRERFGIRIEVDDL